MSSADALKKGMEKMFGGKPPEKPTGAASEAPKPKAELKTAKASVEFVPEPGRKDHAFNCKVEGMTFIGTVTDGSNEWGLGLQLSSPRSVPMIMQHEQMTIGEALADGGLATPNEMCQRVMKHVLEKTTTHECWMTHKITASVTYNSNGDVIGDHIDLTVGDHI